MLELNSINKLISSTKAGTFFPCLYEVCKKCLDSKLFLKYDSVSSFKINISDPCLHF